MTKVAEKRRRLKRKNSEGVAIGGKKKTEKEHWIF